MGLRVQLMASLVEYHWCRLEEVSLTECPAYFEGPWNLSKVSSGVLKREVIFEAVACGSRRLR